MRRHCQRVATSSMPGQRWSYHHNLILRLLADGFPGPAAQIYSARSHQQDGSPDALRLLHRAWLWRCSAGLLPLRLLDARGKASLENVGPMAALPAGGSPTTLEQSQKVIARAARKALEAHAVDLVQELQRGFLPSRSCTDCDLLLRRR